MVRHDIFYKTHEATEAGAYVHITGTEKGVVNGFMYWNGGDPYISEKPKEGTVLCPAPIRDRQPYNPKKDQWKIHIVDGHSKHASKPVFGKFVIESNYDKKSSVNVTRLWRKLKGPIKDGSLPIINMECPETSNRETPPAIHVTTAEEDVDSVAEIILNITGHNIDYITSSGEKKTFFCEKQCKYVLFILVNV